MYLKECHDNLQFLSMKCTCDHVTKRFREAEIIGASLSEPHTYDSRWTVVGCWFGSHVTESLHKSTGKCYHPMHKLLQIVHTCANKVLDSVQQKNKPRRKEWGEAYKKSTGIKGCRKHHGESSEVCICFLNAI